MLWCALPKFDLACEQFGVPNMCLLAGGRGTCLDGLAAETGRYEEPRPTRDEDGDGADKRYDHQCNVE